MSRFSIRRGNTAQNDAYTGYAGELTINTDTKTIRVHDGATLGGTELVTTIFNNFSPTNDADFNNQNVSDINNLTATNITGTNISATNLTASGSTNLQSVNLHQGAMVYGDLTLLNTHNLYVLGAGNATMFSINATNGSATIAGDTTIGGNLTVNGTTTTINSTTQTLDDPIFTLGGDSAPSTDDSKDRGIEFRWHNGVASKVGFFGFDRSSQKFTFIPDATNSSEVFSGTAGNVIFSTGEFTSLSTTDLTTTNLTVTNTITGNIQTASALATSRAISLDGDLSGTANFNGSADITITATIQANSVALGTDTTGSYVSSLVAGTGIALSNNSGEGATPTITLADNVIGSVGTYKSVTVDTYGRVTAGTNPTTLAGYGISDAQPLDATLTALAGVATLADKLIYATASDTFTTTDLSSFGRSLIDDADASTARATLQLVIGTDVQAYDATLAGLASLTTSANQTIYSTGANTFAMTTLSSFGMSLIDDADASTARTTLGLSGFSSDGTNMTISMTDNQPFALDIKEGTTSYLTFGTGNGDEKIVFKKNILVSNKNIEVQDSATNKIFLIDSTDESVSVYDKFYVKNSGNDINKFSVDLDGNVDVSGSLDLTGDLNINTNKFNVSYTSGNTTIAGTLNVTGAITGTSATQTALDNSTKLATTEYVQTATRISTSTKTANYTLAVADEGKMIFMNLGTATTLTIPTNTTASIAIGAQFIISRIGAGTVNIAPADGTVTLTSVSSNRYIANQYGAVTLIKTATNTWYLFGDLSAS